MTGGPVRRLTLVVPGIFGPALEAGPRALDAARLLTEGLRLDALEQLLARAEGAPRRHRVDDLEGLLWECFQVARQGSDRPVAAVTYSVDGGSPAEHWVLRADPVHLRANMGEVTLETADRLEIPQAEAESLAAEVNAHFDDPEFRLQPLHPARWYLCLRDPPRLATRAPSELVSGPIGEHLPTGSDARRWRAIMNEIQMVLHASPVNRDRESRGALSVNGLWLWGGGRSPRIAAGLWQAVWSDDALLTGLAHLGAVPASPVPEDALAWIAATETPGGHLMALTGGHAPARRSDVDAWRSFLTRLEQCWLAPLLVALKGGDMEALILRAEGDQEYRLTRRRLRHWWRRPRPLAEAMVSRGARLGQDA